ncbi:hypothetical protein XENTR_v10024271 [Xenopus tropicalis]|nr:hypothetical protein XENTR_v10024271 [Xenopus tropicalis]
MRERVKETENRISTLEETCNPLPSALTRMDTKLKSCMDKLDDYENRQRRNNVRLVGLPERTEGADPVAFAEGWLKNSLPSASFSQFYAVERAHRVPDRSPPPGGPPRPFLIRLLNFRDRDAILQAVRQSPDIMVDGKKVSVFPDFSAELQRQRGTFTAVKRRLREANLKYGMLYPAKLRVQAGLRTLFFQTSQEASDWLDTRGPQPPRASPNRQD